MSAAAGPDRSDLRPPPLATAASPPAGARGHMAGAPGPGPSLAAAADASATRRRRRRLSPVDPGFGNCRNLRPRQWPGVRHSAREMALTGRLPVPGSSPALLKAQPECCIMLPSCYLPLADATLSMSPQETCALLQRELSPSQWRTNRPGSFHGPPVPRAALTAEHAIELERSERHCSLVAARRQRVKAP